MSSDEEFLSVLIGALSKVRLEAIVVGSTAAALQGAPIVTLDVDLLIRDTPMNRRKLKDLVRTLNATGPVEISPLTNSVTITGARVPIDIIFDMLSGGLSFHSLRSRSKKVKIGDQEAVVADLADIIRSKKAAGRLKDKAQLPILEATLKVKRELDRKR